MTAVSKNVYFDVLDNMLINVNQSSYTFHRFIEMKPIDSYAEHSVDFNEKKD